MRYSSSLSTALSRPLRRPATNEELVARVRLVLETPPGHMPWLPELGCALDRLAGEPMTESAVERASELVTSAIGRWVPEVQVMRCDVRLRMDHVVPGGSRDQNLPIAEASLLPFSAQGTLDIELELRGPDGPLVLDLNLPT
ncbi:MAG TPA: hypothetical protein PKY30_02200 [Myxococcota bacterium]|jgi:phage baseplate assembly protein W|nr:hypothetical protein [Myxococcota bacterium]HNH45816.1 hypothetical protein [Myxococcota bacterium]